MDRTEEGEICSGATILAIQRLLAEAVLGRRPAAEGYSVQGGVVDCNALLDIPCEGDFVDAVFRQIEGREITDRLRRKWLKRLRWIPRAVMVLCLRYTKEGKEHAVHVPGLWISLLFNQPQRGWLGIRMGRRHQDAVRRWVVNAVRSWHGRREVESKPQGVDYGVERVLPRSTAVGIPLGRTSGAIKESVCGKSL